MLDVADAFMQGKSQVFFIIVAELRCQIEQVWSEMYRIRIRPCRQELTSNEWMRPERHTILFQISIVQSYWKVTHFCAVSGFLDQFRTWIRNSEWYCIVSIIHHAAWYALVSRNYYLENKYFYSIHLHYSAPSPTDFKSGLALQRTCCWRRSLAPRSRRESKLSPPLTRTR